jgi:hypothetical protein
VVVAAVAVAVGVEAGVVAVGAGAATAKRHHHVELKFAHPKWHGQMMQASLLRASKKEKQYAHCPGSSSCSNSSTMQNYKLVCQPKLHRNNYIDHK